MQYLVASLELKGLGRPVRGLGWRVTLPKLFPLSLSEMGEVRRLARQAHFRVGTTLTVSCLWKPVSSQAFYSHLNATGAVLYQRINAILVYDVARETPRSCAALSAYGNHALPKQRSAAVFLHAGVPTTR